MARVVERRHPDADRNGCPDAVPEPPQGEAANALSDVTSMGAKAERRDDAKAES
jgi:hypothetical protein